MGENPSFVKFIANHGCTLVVCVRECGEMVGQDLNLRPLFQVALPN